MSNISIIFECPMLVLCHCYMFQPSFYIILGHFITNLLTRCPVVVPIFYFVLCFKKSLKENSSGLDHNLRKKLFDKKRRSPKGDRRSDPGAKGDP